MSMNIDQVFIANPITTNANTDLMYFGQSPYGAGNDAAMTYSNFKLQFSGPITASALSEVSDTNITLALSGSPGTALLQAVQITAGWAGTLSGTRGGTGVNNGASTITLGGSLTTSGAFASTFTMTNTTNVTFPTSGTLATVGQIVTWNDVSSGTQAIAVNQGYITNNGASLVTYTLPVTAAEGSIIEISGKSSGGWTINYATGQIIHLGNSATTVTTGTLSSSNQWDYVKLLCVTANSTWNVIGGVGNLTVV